MAEIKNQKTENIDDTEWDNIDNFINDFAKSNESVSEESESSGRNTPGNFSGTDKKLKTYKTKIIKNNDKAVSNLADVSKNLLRETDDNFSEKYRGLQSDIKTLLAELQEIKRARIDLQSKLDSIR
jgi:hypothetical protein